MIVSYLVGIVAERTEPIELASKYRTSQEIYLIDKGAIRSLTRFDEVRERAFQNNISISSIIQ